MKTLFALGLLLMYSESIVASDISPEIERRAAGLSGCSKSMPCVVSVSTQSDGYIVEVRKSAVITEYGALKFKTGSVTYYMFNIDGKLIRTSPTT